MSTHSERAAVAVGTAILVFAHVVALRHFASRLSVPASATLLIVGLVVAKHTGLLTALRGRFRRRS